MIYTTSSEQNKTKQKQALLVKLVVPICHVKHFVYLRDKASREAHLLQCIHHVETRVRAPGIHSWHCQQ